MPANVHLARQEWIAAGVRNPNVELEVSPDNVFQGF